MSDEDTEEERFTVMRWECPACETEQFDHPPTAGEELTCYNCRWSEQVEAVAVGPAVPDDPAAPDGRTQGDLLGALWVGALLGFAVAMGVAALLGQWFPDEVVAAHVVAAVVTLLVQVVRS